MDKSLGHRRQRPPNAPCWISRAGFPDRFAARRNLFAVGIAPVVGLAIDNQRAGVLFAE